jgi:hypothetical protein
VGISLLKKTKDKQEEGARTLSVGSGVVEEKELTEMQTPFADVGQAPAEVLLQVFQYLYDARDILAAGLVCRGWHAMANDDSYVSNTNVIILYLFIYSIN